MLRSKLLIYFGDVLCSLAGRYDYQYVHRETEGEEFTARAGQRIMTKDLIKQEITIAEGSSSHSGGY